MIPIDLDEARRALFEKKINMWEMTLLEGVHKPDDISEKQYNILCVLAEQMLPYKLIRQSGNSANNGCPVDPYFKQQYYSDEY